MIDTLSAAILADLRRLHSYGWLPGHIAHILNRLHGLDLTPKEVKRMCHELDKNEAKEPKREH